MKENNSNLEIAISKLKKSLDEELNIKNDESELI